jgi:hypothetical protein
LRKLPAGSQTNKQAITGIQELKRALFPERFSYLISTIMDNMLHSTALILIIYWAIGFFALGAGFFIHILLIVAFVFTTLAVLHGKQKSEA